MTPVRGRAAIARKPRGPPAKTHSTEQPRAASSRPLATENRIGIGDERQTDRLIPAFLAATRSRRPPPTDINRAGYRFRSAVCQENLQEIFARPGGMWGRAGQKDADRQKLPVWPAPGGKRKTQPCNGWASLAIRRSQCSRRNHKRPTVKKPWASGYWNRPPRFVMNRLGFMGPPPLKTVLRRSTPTIVPMTRKIAEQATRATVPPLHSGSAATILPAPRG